MRSLSLAFIFIFTSAFGHIGRLSRTGLQVSRDLEMGFCVISGVLGVRVMPEVMCRRHNG